MAENDAQVRRSVLLVLAHPALERSRANSAMAIAADELPNVAVHDLYETYPDFLIDVAEEQTRLLDYEVIVLQFPLYWYSVPSLLKEWIDAVWLHGFAYGQDGHALDGKTMFVACSAGSHEDDYRPGGAHRYSALDFLRPLERTAALCRMNWVEPFVLTQSRLRSPESLAVEVKRYKGRLSRLSRPVLVKVKG
jgi:glutathione-regulated potassium-efflux system ancillary protein KefG